MDVKFLTARHYTNSQNSIISYLLMLSTIAVVHGHLSLVGQVAGHGHLALEAAVAALHLGANEKMKKNKIILNNTYLKIFSEKKIVNKQVEN